MTDNEAIETAPSTFEAPGSAAMYAALSQPFEHVHQLPGRGDNGKPFDYITGEQCITRLNQTLGYGGWSFEVVAHGINEDADEVWVHGRLLFEAPAMPRGVGVREDFGSEKIKRLRSTQKPVEIGFQFKAAATDALKRCAHQIGVALDLYHKQAVGEAALRARPDEPNEEAPRQMSQPRQQPAQRPAAKTPKWSEADAAIEQAAKDAHKPADLAFIAMVGQIRQAGNEAKLRSVADTMAKDIELRPDRAEVWTEARKMAARHLVLDMAEKLGFVWKAAEAPAAANPAA